MSRAALATVRRGARLVSICTGAFVLAAAGLLDGRPATTHWKYADELAALHPDVRVDAGVLFTDDGDVLTSAGLSAGVDLCLHLIRRDHGSRGRQPRGAALRRTAVARRRPGAVHRAPRAPPGRTSRRRRRAPGRWSTSRPTCPRWPARAGMSLRTFARRFREETGQSPGAWLIQQRVRHAQHLLEATDLPVDEVAERAGMGTAASLRAHLRTHAGVSPAATAGPSAAPASPGRPPDEA